jgi:hypothetical protein
MWFSKIAISTGAALASFGTNIPGRIVYSLGLTPFLDYENDHFLITIGLCVLTGGVVAFQYERASN